MSRSCSENHPPTPPHHSWTRLEIVSNRCGKYLLLNLVKMATPRKSPSTCRTRQQSETNFRPDVPPPTHQTKPTPEVGNATHHEKHCKVVSRMLFKCQLSTNVKKPNSWDAAPVQQGAKGGSETQSARVATVLWQPR